MKTKLVYGGNVQSLVMSILDGKRFFAESGNGTTFSMMVNFIKPDAVIITASPEISVSGIIDARRLSAHVKLFELDTEAIITFDYVVREVKIIVLEPLEGTPEVVERPMFIQQFVHPKSFDKLEIFIE